jgi:O-succinylbenzoate synthase
MSMGVHLAALNPNEADAGLGTLSLFAGDVCERLLVPQDARLAVGRVTPSESRLEIFKAEDHRADWWMERLERCFRLV